jgi:3,5-epimerase/4-reductase
MVNTTHRLKHINLFIYMKLLIFGANGWIGSQFLVYLDHQGIEYYKSGLRADDTEKVTTEITMGGYTHVLSLIGRTSGTYNDESITTIDYLEKPGMLRYNVRDNLYAPVSLALICKGLGIHFTYLGTGCIFEYDDDHSPTQNGWTEGDAPNFFGSSYSTVKGYTDRLMHMFGNVLNLRIRMPISKDNHPKNFISKITKYEKICSMPNSMTVLHTFFPVIISLMQNKTTGTFNCTNPGVITHNEILEMYRELVDPTFEWKNFSLEEQDQILASKRSNNHLDTNKLSEMYRIPDIHRAVRDTLLAYKNVGHE